MSTNDADDDEVILLEDVIDATPLIVEMIDLTAEDYDELIISEGA